MPLAALRDPALVLRHTARTLDIVEQPDRPLGDVLAEVLGGKRMLLLLDNAEHLLPDAADAIATLRDLDGPNVVVTSRERLQLAGEHVYPVPQLTPVEGQDLFAARAAAIDPTFEADAAVAGALRPPRQPAPRDRARGRAHRGAPARADPGAARRPTRPAQGRPRRRSTSADAARDDRLVLRPPQPDERELAGSFSVFAGGATLEAVEDVCQADLDTLASLVDKSLLRRDGDRFWMLETIREYGTDQLDDACRRDLIERHGAFYERFAAAAEKALRGRDGAMWLDLVEHDLPNLRAAMGRALELGLVARTLRIATGVGRYWTARSGETEGRRWLDQALTAGPVENRARAAGCFWAGFLAFVQGDLVAAAESFAAAARAAQAAGEVFLEAMSSGYLGFVAHEGGNDAAAQAPHEQSRALLAQLTDPWERSEVLVSLSGWGETPPSRRRSSRSNARLAT